MMTLLQSLVARIVSKPVPPNTLAVVDEIRRTLDAMQDALSSMSADLQGIVDQLSDFCAYLEGR